MKKVLRAIGGFFARIGRWIANTAWVQPLLIVGGIFAIIFSIPYIKRAIEQNIADNTVDSELAYYTDRAISLTNAEVGNGESNFDKLLTALEEYTPEDIEYIEKTFGKKFFLSFAEEDCQNCKDCAKGYSKFQNIFASEYHLDKVVDTRDNKTVPYKFYSVMADTVVDNSSNKYDGKYSAELVLNRHQSFLEEIVANFAESTSGTRGYSYNLLNNIDSSNAETVKSSIMKLANVSEEGIDVPTTLLIDITGDANKPECAYHGVSGIVFNYISLMKDDVNVINEASFLRDCWTYSNAFSGNGKEIHYVI